MTSHLRITRLEDALTLLQKAVAKDRELSQLAIDKINAQLESIEKKIKDLLKDKVKS